MMITRETYEVFFLDYIEGNLAPNLVSELQSFLLQNPDLAEELEGTADASLSFNEEIFLFKNELKKQELPISEDELNLLLAKEIEGHLIDDEQSIIDNLASQFPFVNAQRLAFSKSIFTPENIVFEEKSSLHFNENIDLSHIQMRIVASLEGDLDKEQEAELTKQIVQNESLSIEKSLFAKTILRAEQVVLDDKQKMAVPTSLDMREVQNLLIAKVEGDLTFEQNQELALQLANNKSLHAELSLFYKTKLKPDAMAFETKNNLHKKETLVLPLRRIVVALSSAAAIVALIVWFNFNSNVAPSQIASTENRNPEIKNLDTQIIDNSVEKKSTQVNTSTKKEKQLLVLPEQNESNSVAIQIRKKPNTNKPLPIQKQDSIAHEFPLMNNPIIQFPEENIGFIESDSSKSIVPDMSPILSPDSNFEKAMAVANNDNNPAAKSKQTPSKAYTIWQYLGDRAEKRIEKTAAYALVERQAEKIAPQRDKFKYERTKDELKLKVGKFELSRNSKKQSKNFVSTLLDHIKQKTKKEGAK